MGGAGVVKNPQPPSPQYTSPYVTKRGILKKCFWEMEVSIARHSWKGLLRWQIDKKEDLEGREALFLTFRGESQLIKDYLRATAAAAVAKLLLLYLIFFFLPCISRESSWK